MRNSGPARFLIPIGLALIVFGGIMLGFDFSSYEETTGSITAVAEDRDEDNHTVYDVSFTYTVDGKKYEGSFEDLGGEYATGEDIAVFYDPENPNAITNSKTSVFTAPVMIVAGAAAVAFGTLQTVRAFRKSRELEQSASGEYVPSADFEAFKHAVGVKEYYSRFDGVKLKPGYILEDADRRTLFEGKMLKNNPVGARRFEFSNHRTGAVTEHEVGHTTTVTYNNEFFSEKSWFKFDGRNIWDVLHERGLRMKTDLHSRFPYVLYDVTKDGEAFARIETSSAYLYEEEEAKHKVVIPFGSYYYKIWTNSDDLELVFLAVFAISETEQTVVE